MPKKHRRKRHITIRVTEDVSDWLRENDYSPSAIFYEAIKEIGYKRGD